MSINRRGFLTGVSAAAIVLSLSAPSEALRHAIGISGYSQQNPSFSGNPYVNITAIDVSGGIACSRSGTIYTPAFVMVSASNVTATGTTIPYEDLEFTWTNNSGGTETFVNPITKQVVNPNVGQRGGEAAFCFRAAGTYRITLNARGANGTGGIGATATTFLDITITDFASLSGMTDWYYDSAASGTGTGTSIDPFSCMTGGLPDMTNMSAKLSVPKARLNIKRGSSWTITPDTPGLTKDSFGVVALYLAASQTRMQPYGSGANPIIKVQNNLVAFHGTISNGSGAAGTQLNVTSVLPNTAPIKVGQYICVDSSGNTNKIVGAPGGGGVGLYTVLTSQLKADFAMTNIPVAPIGTHPNVASLDDFVVSNIDFPVTGNLPANPLRFVWSDIPTSNIYFDNVNAVTQLDSTAVFTASISSDDVLHVTAVSSGTIIPSTPFFNIPVMDATGNVVRSTLTLITGFLTGTEGGVGTYSVTAKAQTVASEAMELRSWYGQAIRYQPSEVQNPTGAAINAGVWGGSETSGAGDRGVGTGYFGGARNWNFIFGWSPSGEGGDPVRDHHIYPDQLQHALYRYINFGSGPNRNYCINTNWDNNNGGSSIQFPEFLCMSDNLFTGTNFAHDGSDGNNSVDVVRFRNFVVQLNAVINMRSGCVLFFSTASITWRNNNVAGCPNANWQSGIAGITASASILKAKIYDNNIYRGPGQDGGQSVIDFTRSGAFTQPQFIKGNKIQDDSTAALCIGLIVADQVSAGSAIDNQTYYGPNRVDQKLFASAATDGTALIFSAWKTAGAAINLDVNSSSTINPGFADPANGRF